MHVDAPDALVELAGHAVHVDAPAALKVPALQAVHATNERCEKGASRGRASARNWVERMAALIIGFTSAGAAACRRGAGQACWKVERKKKAGQSGSAGDSKSGARCAARTCAGGGAGLTLGVGASRTVGAVGAAAIVELVHGAPWFTQPGTGGGTDQHRAGVGGDHRRP